MLLRLGNLGNVDDGQLLERFRTCGDAQGAEAFRVLIDRYGPIVMGEGKLLHRANQGCPIGVTASSTAFVYRGPPESRNHPSGIAPDAIRLAASHCAPGD